MKKSLTYELELDSVDDLSPPEEPVDLVWNCMSGWKIEALLKDETERVNSYVVMDKVSKKANSLIAQHKNVHPKGDWDFN
ncbi:hypothetical protein BG015_010536 [Linnemannia schmuckeri]|uniref:Uncharacterized protein n=1 Tax=Linnemannia schmuckeri TaxID=64567 RepID=A0A9P5RWM8_9FUNG|nr:hypothetical protein BG015_010536 [Linnemannia schmuckeri]